MLTTYFKRQTTQATYYSGPAGPYLDEFTNWLEQRGYRHETIRYRLQGAAQFVTWAQTTGCNLPSLSPATLDHFRCHLSKHHQLRHTGGQLSVRWLGAQLFFEFLQDQQLVAPADTSLEVTHPELLSAFAQWMHVHRGVRPSTLITYQPHITELLIELGEDPERFDVAQLRTVILAYAQHHSAALSKKRVTAFRMFLRFLTATGRAQPELEAAIPAIAQWRLATLPRYLRPEDLERVMAACDGSTARGMRDKAIVLLLLALVCAQATWPTCSSRISIGRRGPSGSWVKVGVKRSSPYRKTSAMPCWITCTELVPQSKPLMSFSLSLPHGHRLLAMSSNTPLPRPSNVPVLKRRRLVPMSCATRQRRRSSAKGPLSK